MKSMLLTLAGLLCCCPAASAGAHRHDKPVALFKALAAQPQFDCAGQLQDFRSGHPAATGSCVLIGERFLLTAAHVVMESDYRLDTIYQGSQRIIVNQPYNTRPADVSMWIVQLGRRSYRLKLARIFPAYLDSATRGPSSDLALIELAEPVTNVRPARLNRHFDELHDTLAGVGYGASGPANDAELVDFHNEKIAGQNRIDSIGGDIAGGRPALLMADFDCPAQQADCNVMGQATPLPMEYGPISGDSGCGAFRKTAGGWELIGILASNGGQNLQKLIRIGYYGQLSQWVRISVYADWIEREMQRR